MEDGKRPLLQRVKSAAADSAIFALLVMVFGSRISDSIISRFYGDYYEVSELSTRDVDEDGNLITKKETKVGLKGYLVKIVVFTLLFAALKIILSPV